MSVSRGQLRIFFIVLFFFLAIKIVLYQSATYEVSAAARVRRDIEAKRVFQESTKDRIALKSRMRVERIFSVKVKDSDESRWTGESTESAARLSDEWHRGGANYVQSEGEQTRTLKPEVHHIAESLRVNLSLRRPQTSNLFTSKPESSSIMADSTKSEHDFDSEKVLLLFQKCKEENGDLSVECYNDAYEELCKLFKPLGTIFNFVTSDIVEKIGILRDYQKSDIGEHFRTIQTMVKYEVDNNLTIQKKKASGCRTLLRLHRALEFISALLTKIRNTDNSCKFSSEATEAYDKTLAKYHPWLIRKAVHVAMYTLPDRQNLLIKMKVPDTPDGMAKVEALIGQLNTVYDITQRLYADHNLLDLP